MDPHHTTTTTTSVAGPPPGSSSPSSLRYKKEKETVGGVMVNGYWFPSLAAAAEAPAGKGFDFAEAAAAAAADAARAEEERRQLRVSFHSLSLGTGLYARRRRGSVGGTQELVPASLIKGAEGYIPFFCLNMHATYVRLLVSFRSARLVVRSTGVGVFATEKGMGRG